jgi:signal transduction histidine kinase/CheY-like chemotaxis protein
VKPSAIFSGFNTSETRTVSRRNVLLERRIDHILRQQFIAAWPVTFTGAIGVLIFGIATHWFTADSRFLLGWTLLFLLNLVFVAYFYVRYSKVHFDPRDETNARVNSILNFSTIMTSALVFGLGAMFFFLRNTREDEVISILGLGIVCLVFLLIYTRVSHIFFGNAILTAPLIALLLERDTYFHYMALIMFVLFVLVVSGYGVYLVRTRREAVRLRFLLETEKSEAITAREEAEQANIAKSKFLAAASHDLRQPLHALTLFSGALKDRTEYPEIKGIVANIAKSVSGLDALFNALLDITKLDAGTVRPEIRTFPLNNILLGHSAEYQAQAQAKNLDWRCPYTDIVVRTDPTLLDTILRNLISNAIRYTQRGRISVNCEQVEKLVRIEVCDTGIGVPIEQQREIFREFHQLHNPERDRTKGLGLGLAIVERLSQLLNIQLDLVSVPGEGSCFSLELTAGNPSDIVDENLEEEGGLRDPLSGVGVLVIDDETDIREGMRALLEGWGCTVHTAVDCSSALKILNIYDWVPNIIVADYQLPDHRTGADAIESIQTAYETVIPAIIVTGDTDPDRLRDAQNSGFPVLHKPVKPAKLRAVIHRTVMKKV